MEVGFTAPGHVFIPAVTSVDSVVLHDFNGSQINETSSGLVDRILGACPQCVQDYFSPEIKDDGVSAVTPEMRQKLDDHFAGMITNNPADPGTANINSALRQSIEVFQERVNSIRRQTDELWPQLSEGQQAQLLKVIKAFDSAPLNRRMCQTEQHDLKRFSPLADVITTIQEMKNNPEGGGSTSDLSLNEVFDKMSDGDYAVEKMLEMDTDHSLQMKKDILYGAREKDGSNYLRDLNQMTIHIFDFGWDPLINAELLAAEYKQDPSQILDLKKLRSHPHHHEKYNTSSRPEFHGIHSGSQRRALNDDVLLQYREDHGSRFKPGPDTSPEDVALWESRPHASAIKASGPLSRPEQELMRRNCELKDTIAPKEVMEKRQHGCKVPWSQGAHRSNYALEQGTPFQKATAAAGIQTNWGSGASGASFRGLDFLRSFKSFSKEDLFDTGVTLALF